MYTMHVYVINVSFKGENLVVAYSEIEMCEHFICVCSTIYIPTQTIFCILSCE